MLILMMVLKFESTFKLDGIRWCHHFEDNDNMKLAISWYQNSLYEDIENMR